MNETGISKFSASGEKINLRTRPLNVLLVIVAAILLGVIFFLPRSISLGSFVTADEPTWAKRSASFFYALNEKDYPDTYQTGHPGVITMWAGAIAYHLKFPAYLKVGQESLGDTRLLQLFLQHGPTPIELIATARLVVVLLITTSMVVAFLLARQLFGMVIAIFMFLLIAFEPFFVAHSRVLHTNGLLASFMFLSLIAYIYYLRTRAISGLLISGIGLGLSILCISPAIALIPTVGLITLGSLWDGEARRLDISFKSLLQKVAIPFFAWALIGLVIIFITWPAMWSSPIGTLTRMLQYGMNAAEGEIGGAHFVGAYQDTEVGSNYLYFYPMTYLWRSTPIILIGITLAILMLVFRRSLIQSTVRRSLVDVAIFILVYSLIMTIGTKKYDRYYLPVYLALDVFAAVGWIASIHWLGERFASLNKKIFQYWLLGIILVPQVFSTLQSAPYYFTYFNPLMGGLQKAPQAVTVGWGEGLNEAALYLAQQPGACNQKILSWYPLAFSWYSISFGCGAQMVEFSPDMTLQDYLSYDYIVIYINQIQRNQPPELLAYLSKIQPIHSVVIDGVEFVRIYKLKPDQKSIQSSWKIN